MSELILTRWQKEIIADTVSDEIIVTAGYGTGKTTGAALWGIDRLSYNAGCDGLCVLPQWSLVKRVGIPAFEEAFEMVGYKPKEHYEIRLSTQDCHILIVPTGQKIMFLSGEKPGNIVGISTCAWAILDEIALMEQEVLQKTSARLRYKKASKIQILMTTTTEGENWVSDLYDSDTLDRWTKHDPSGKVATTIRKVNLPGGKIVEKQIKRIRATTFSNEHNLDPAYIPNLFDSWRHNQNYIDAYVYGYFRPFATGLAYSNYRSQLHKVDPEPVDPGLPIHLTWDFNIEPQWVSIQERVEYTGDLYLSKRKYWQAMHNANQGHDNLEDCCIEFMVKHPRNVYGNTPIYVYGDPTGYHRSHKVKLSDFKEIKRILNKLGYKRVEIVAIKQAPLERVSVNYVQQFLAERTFRIGANCDRVLKSITRTTWKDGAQGKLDKPAGDTWTHPMDAVKYFVCALLHGSKTLTTGRA